MGWGGGDGNGGDGDGDGGSDWWWWERDHVEQHRGTRPVSEILDFPV